MSDVYVTNGINSKDKTFLIIAVALSLLLLFQNTAFGGGQNGSYSTIYYPILAFAISIIAAAIISKGRLFNEVIYGRIANSKKLYEQIIIVSVIAGTIAYYVYTSNISAAAFLPLSVSSTSATTLSQVAILVFIGVIIEELFARCGLTPTFTNALGNTNVLAALGLLGGVIFLYMFQVALVGYAFLALTFIALAMKFTKKNFFNGDGIKHVTGASLSIFIWVLYHVWSYGSLPNVYSLMLTLAIFGAIIELINWYFQNAISGFIIHSAINGAVIVALTPTLFGSVVLIEIIMVLMIVVLYSGPKNTLAALRR